LSTQLELQKLNQKLQSNFIERATYMAPRGFGIVPIPRRQKRCLEVGWQHSYREDLVDRLKQVTEWSSKYSNANYGVMSVLGVGEPGVFDLDADGLRTRIEAETGQEIPDTFSVRRGTHEHYYFLQTAESVPHGLIDGEEKDEHKLHLFEWRVGEGFQTVGPGSLHPSREFYEVTRDLPLAPLPGWLLEWILKYRKVEKSKSSIPSAKVVKRHPDFDAFDFLERYAGLKIINQRQGSGGEYFNLETCPRAQRAHKTHGPTSTALFLGDDGSLGFQCNSSGCADYTIGPLIEQLEKEHGPYDHPIWDITYYTDQHLVERFARQANASLSYLVDDAGWRKYSGGLWTQHPVGPIYEIGEYLKSEVPDKSTMDAKHWAQLHHRLNSQKLVTAVKSLAVGRPELHRRADDFDPNDMLLGLPDGQCLSLVTGDVRLATPDDLITKSLSCAPADAESERWLQFLNETHPDDLDTQNFLKRFFGYCLTASVREDVLLFFVGIGGSGKNTTVEPFSTLLGPYYGLTSVATFLEDTGGDRRANYLAELYGTRLVVCNEGSKSKPLDNQALKDLTGGGLLEARRLCHQPFRFKKTFKILILANDPPVLELDDAFRQRIRIVAFNEQFRGTDRCNPDLRDFFKTPREQAGILRWALNGCFEWQKSGLGHPKAMATAVDDYFQDADLLGNFLDEHTKIGPHHFVSTQTLFDCWQNYRRAKGERLSTIRVFVPDLLKRCIGVVRDAQARPRGLRGIRLRSDQLDM